jgi:hypothetical protein
LSWAIAEKSLVNEVAEIEAAAAVVAVALDDELDDELDFELLLHAASASAVPAAVAAIAMCLNAGFIVAP